MSSAARLALCSVCCLTTAACLIPRETPDCTEDLECKPCIERSGCGYCAGEPPSCIPGTILGPDDVARCTDGAFHFFSCPAHQEPVNDADLRVDCSRYDSCVECVADPSCGYCLEGVDCRPRDRPSGCQLVTSDDECQGRSWCDNADSCVECVLIEGCAYCLASDQCLRADRPGGCELLRSVDDGRCDPSVCRDATECADCSIIPGCGYCPDTRSCRSTTATGGCDLVESPAACPIEECEDAERCEDCVELPCRWCDRDGGFCHEPYDDACHILYDFPSSREPDLCPTPNGCSQHTTCHACLADWDCGWCTHPTLVESGDGLCLLAFGATIDFGWRCSGYFWTSECP